mgnify:FL=1|jgi:hypothetical protein
MTEEEYHQWELEQQEQEEEEAKKPAPREWYNVFHDTFTPNIWREAKKYLEKE